MPAPRSSTTSAAAWPTPRWSPLVAERPAALRRHALARPQHARCRPRAVYDDVVADVVRELARAASRRCSAAGVAPEPSCSTPGSGSPSTPSTTGRCCAASTRSWRWATRSLVGASRKTFLGAGRARAEARPGPPLERDVATAATTVHVARHGVWCVRVHDVVATVDALDVVEAPARRRGRDARERRLTRDRIRLSRGPRPRLPRRLRRTSGARARSSSSTSSSPSTSRRPGAATTSPTRSTTPRSAPTCWPGSRASRSTSSSGSPRSSPTTRCGTRVGRRGRRHGAQAAGAGRRAVRRRARSRSRGAARRCPSSSPRGEPPRATAARGHRSRPPSRRSRGIPDVAVVGGLDAVRDRPGRRPGPAGLPQRRGDRPHHALAHVAAARAARHRGGVDRRREVRWGARTLDLDLVQYGDPACRHRRHLRPAAPDAAAPAGPRAGLRARAVGSRPTPRPRCGTRAGAVPVADLRRRPRHEPACARTRPHQPDTRRRTLRADARKEIRVQTLAPGRGGDRHHRLRRASRLITRSGTPCPAVAAVGRAARRHGRAGALAGPAGAPLPAGPGDDRRSTRCARRAPWCSPRPPPSPARLPRAGTSGSWSSCVTDLSLEANRGRLLPLGALVVAGVALRRGRAGGPALVPACAPPDEDDDEKGDRAA